MMIVGNLAGGLGNQMFQYACARALALKLALPLKFTIDTFGQYTSHHHGLEIERVFGVPINVPEHIELRNLVGVGRTNSRVRRLIAKRNIFGLRKRTFLSEPCLQYWSELNNLAINGAYLHGYWQSEKYFERYSDLIRADFSVKSFQSDKNLLLAEHVTRCCSVSIHVRRGDYVSNPKTSITHGTCSIEYYFKSIELILQRFPDARFFAFSDDLDWVAKIFKSRFPDMVLVDHNRGLDSYIDMFLMSMCQHHIIANSSFSWWGAWLNPSSTKLVIAPDHWYADGRNTDDLIPNNWMRI